jgi:DnaJ-class molecular chaperone
MTIPPGSNTGSVLRLKGKGIATGSATGDLYVKLVLTLPERPDSELRRFVETWAATYDPRTKLT